MTTLIPAVLVLSGLAHVNVGQEQASQFVDAIVNVVVAFTTLTSMIAIFIGIGRKMLVGIGVVKPTSVINTTSNQ